MKWITTLACLAGLIAAPACLAQSRAGTFETRLGIAIQNSADADFEGGTTAEFDSDTGFRVGFSKHYTDHWEFGGNFGYGQTDYEAAIVGDQIGEIFDVRGEFEYLSLSGDVTYNLFSGPFTPFVVGAIGWTWVDTNIATEPPQTGCWWDPWWGYVCSTFQDTKSIDGFTYQLGVGARYDFRNNFAIHGSYRVTWVDLDNADGTPDFDGFEVSVGWKF
jgi:opacity protein-like surface antigen